MTPSAWPRRAATCSRLRMPKPAHTGTVARARTQYLDRVRARSTVPVCAGFGIRSREQVQALRGHADGVIVGSALVEVLERGDDPARWLSQLRA